MIFETVQGERHNQAKAKKSLEGMLIVNYLESNINGFVGKPSE